MPKICPICKTNPVSGRNRICDSISCRKEMQKTWYEGNITIPDGYLTAAEYAKKKGISIQAVTKNCRAGKFLDAFQDPRSGRWYVPGPEFTGENIEIVAAARRKKRPFSATDKEWEKIIEKVALTKYTVNEYIIRCALGKKV